MKRPIFFLLAIPLALLSCSDTSVKQIPVNVPKNIAVPPDMVYIPEGEFLMGPPEKKGTVRGKKIRLHAYLIDRHEVDWKQYREFKPDDGSGKDRFPATHVNYFDAEAYCRWKGKRLPTEAEWEKAARGVDGRKWPWKVYYVHPNDGFSGFIPEEVDKREEWVSPYGVYGMGYNVWEWISDWYSYAGMPEANREKFKIIRGGLTQTHLTVKHSPAWFRNYMDPQAEYNFIGLRCAMDAGKALKREDKGKSP
ncbi:MAG: formylglycine-generating enzyme family protein [Nitrospinales bacterium]